MNHLEIEYKTLLSHEEYQKLLPEFAEIESVEQTNYYIDTPDFDMKANRCSLRIRTFSDAAELTLKIPQEIGNMEHNQDLKLQEAQRLITEFQLPKGPIKDLLTDKAIPLENLAVWGFLTTKRLEKMSDFGLMALDENTYLGQTDYELEVEVSDAEAGKIAFDKFLEHHHIQFKYASSKVARTAAQKKSAK
ncbi:CYTH domain-containing protein [Streptococcus gallolyticus]|nr:CYTH domain-containing protein [Streptococcus gallolyticus]MBY5041283.1 CYTH domain-containing protein [Streptococcus gallolyticus]